jgi:TetR/AcrR family transcriptional regulator, regulator of cefoperazone and chloramphenicol sensitivity
MKKAKHSRTQTRSVESRRAVIDAVVKLIAERGFASVTTAAIAAQAGVSWGVLQYHFGSKDAIFAAVLDSSLQDLLALLEQTVPPGGDPRQCLAAAVDAVWSCYSQPTYRAAMEILLNCSHRSTDFLSLAQRAGRSLEAAVIRILQQCDRPLDTKQARRVTEIMLGALRGFAVSNALSQAHKRQFRSERALLTESLLALLESRNPAT